MKIEFNKENGTGNIALDGRLDTTTAPELESALGGHYEGTDALIFDCEKLVYVSSAGLRILLGAHKRMKGAMKLTGVNELVMEVFEMTGFADILTIE